MVFHLFQIVKNIKAYHAGKSPEMSSLNMQALEGLKVVEVANIIAGPWCGSMLADFGATVIKVEPPKGGRPDPEHGPHQGDVVRGRGT